MSGPGFGRAKAILGRAGSLALSFVARIGWPIALVAAVFVGSQARSLWNDWQQFREYRNRPPESGAGVIASETPESREAERVLIPVGGVGAPLSDRQRRTVGGRGQGQIVGQRLTGDAARAFEDRTGADIDADGSIAGRTAAEVTRERTEEGGRRGRELEERHPAAVPQTALGTFEMDATGERDATIDVLWNPDSGVVSPIISLHDLPRIRWPNLFRLRGQVQFDSANGWAPTLDDWRAGVDWVPVSIALTKKKSTYVDLTLSAEREHRTFPFGEVNETTYWIGATIECRRPWKLDCSP